jgi:P-type Ca2+ transporter type 2A
MIDGTTFSPDGHATRTDGSKAPSTSQSEALRRTAEIAALCNDAKVVYNAVSFYLEYQSIHS